MFSFIKSHPFAVEAHFESSHVLTFAFPKAQLEHLIPECLELDTFKDKWAFIAVAMVQTKHLRPKGFPKILGNDFFLIGYRVFVKYINASGKRLRGLFILKSETDKTKMKFFGNIFTHYNYSQTDVAQNRNQEWTQIESKQSKFSVSFKNSGSMVNLPNNSPFEDWKEARRFAGPLPFTFTYDEPTRKILFIEGVRKNWKPEPIQVTDYDIDFFRERGLPEPILANAFVLSDIPYYWKKGKIESWSY